MYSCVSSDLEEIPCEELRFAGNDTESYVGMKVIIRDTSDYIKYGKTFYEQFDSLIMSSIVLSENSIIGKTIVLDDIGDLLDAKARLFKVSENNYVYQIEITHTGFRNNEYMTWCYSKTPKFALNDSIRIDIVYNRKWLFFD